MIDRAHIGILRAAEHYVELEHHILVHAGLEPGVPLRSQDPYKLMWIREPFLSYKGSFGKTVVHGHTPTVRALVEEYPNRIAVDTGTGVLSALHIHPEGIVDVVQALVARSGTIQVKMTLSMGARAAVA